MEKKQKSADILNRNLAENINMGGSSTDSTFVGADIKLSYQPQHYGSLLLTGAYATFKISQTFTDYRTGDIKKSYRNSEAIGQSRTGVWCPRPGRRVFVVEEDMSFLYEGDVFQAYSDLELAEQRSNFKRHYADELLHVNKSRPTTTQGVKRKHEDSI